MAGKHSIKHLVLVLTAASMTFLAGCATHVAVGYRAYDPGYRDYHTWNDAEIGYYNQWIVETRHAHVDYRRLHRQDQHAYWQWRHNHH